MRESAELWTHVRTPPAIEGFPEPRGGPEGVAQWIAERCADGTCVWAIHAGGAAVGLVTADLRAAGTAVVGYSVDDARTGGDELATQALRSVVQWLFEVRGLHRVELRVATSSLALWRVAQQAGFVLEGVARESWRWNGAWHDARIYALLEREWRAQQRRVTRVTPVSALSAG